MSPEHAGTTAWLAIGLGVITYDLLGPETLSSAFKRAREHENPAVRVAAVGALAVTAAHLLDWLPERIDPFNVIDRKYHERA